MKNFLHDFDMLLEDTGTDIIDITKPIAKKAAEIGNRGYDYERSIGVIFQPPAKSRLCCEK